MDNTIDETEIKVRRAKCLCGKTRMVAVIDPNGEPFSKDTIKDFKTLVTAGCNVDTISLEEARKVEMCFSCKL